MAARPDRACRRGPPELHRRPRGRHHQRHRRPVRRNARGGVQSRRGADPGLRSAVAPGRARDRPARRAGRAAPRPTAALPGVGATGRVRHGGPPAHMRRPRCGHRARGGGDPRACVRDLRRDAPRSAQPRLARVHRRSGRDLERTGGWAVRVADAACARRGAAHAGRLRGQSPHPGRLRRQDLVAAGRRRRPAPRGGVPDGGPFTRPDARLAARPPHGGRARADGAHDLSPRPDLGALRPVDPRPRRHRRRPERGALPETPGVGALGLAVLWGLVTGFLGALLAKGVRRKGEVESR